MQDLLETFGIQDENMGATTGVSNGWLRTRGRSLTSVSPIDGRPIARVMQATAEDYQKVMHKALQAFDGWRMTPSTNNDTMFSMPGRALPVRATKSAIVTVSNIPVSRLITSILCGA